MNKDQNSKRTLNVVEQFLIFI